VVLVAKIEQTKAVFIFQIFVHMIDEIYAFFVVPSVLEGGVKDEIKRLFVHEIGCEFHFSPLEGLLSF